MGVQSTENSNFSRLILLKNTYPNYLILSSERKQRFYLTVSLMASINQHLSLTALCQPLSWVSRVVGVWSRIVILALMSV